MRDRGLAEDSPRSMTEFGHKAIFFDASKGNAMRGWPGYPQLRFERIAATAAAFRLLTRGSAGAVEAHPPRSGHRGDVRQCLKNLNENIGSALP